MTSVLPLLLAAFLQSPASPMVTVERDLMSGIEEPREAVARAPEEWKKLWREHAGDKPAPPVDFGTRTVVAVFLGTRPTAGFSVAIIAIRAEGTGLVVQWSEKRPDRDMVSAQVLTSPAHIVTVPKVGGPIRFEKAGR